MTMGGDMNRQRPHQPNAAELVDKFWILQTDARSPETEEPLSVSAEIEFAAMAEALSPDRHKLGSAEYGRFLALYYSLMQNSRMTFLEFVKTRFIPQHVMTKGRAGQTHYHAILKHILKPETVDALFDPETERANKKLSTLPEWPYIDHIRLCEINADHVRKLIQAAFDKAYSVQTVTHIRNVIGAVINHATKTRCFSGDNPASQVPLPRMIRRPGKQLTVNQAKQLLRALKKPDREVALMAIFTGLNMLEICGLQWKHVNLGESPRRNESDIIPPKSIAVRRQLNAGRLDEVRSSRIRNVPVSGVVIPLLEKLSQNPLCAKPDDLVFTSRTGAALWPANLHERLKRLGNELDMQWISWHQLTKAHKTMSSALESKLSYGDSAPQGAAIHCRT
jgi:site-specific recombinase XerC